MKKYYYLKKLVLRESIMSINKINEALSNEKKENQKLQKKSLRC